MNIVEVPCWVECEYASARHPQKMGDHQSVQGVGLHRLMLVLFTPLAGEAVILWTPAGEDLAAFDWEPS